MPKLQIERTEEAWVGYVLSVPHNPSRVGARKKKESLSLGSISGGAALARQKIRLVA